MLIKPSHKMEPEITFTGSICRICLQLSLNRYDIVRSGLQYLFCELTGMQIKSDDGLPTVMCPTCVYLLNKAVRFRRKCFDSNVYLCNFLHSGQTEFDVDKSLRPPYLTLNFSETVICEVPSTICDKVGVKYQDAMQNVFHESDHMDSIPDFEPFDVNGATIEPLPSGNMYTTTPNPIQNRKRKRQGKVKIKNEEESLKTAIANMQDMYQNRSMMEVPLNSNGIPDINKYFSVCNDENGQPEYVLKELHQSNVAENASVEEVLTIDESCLYALKPQYKEFTKYFKAQDGTAINTCSLMGPRYLRVEHLTLKQQLEVMEKQRNSEKYLTSAFHCESCALSFPLEYSYKKHMRRHSVSAGPFQCSICKVRMVGRQGLQRHNNSHRLRFVCMICGARLRSRAQHSLHVMTKHIGMPEMLCLLCNKRYKNPLTFRSHNLRQHSKSAQRYQCPHCPESFKWRNTMYTHIADKHVGALPYPCNKCPKSFAQLFPLQQHKLYVHDRQELLCEHCKLALPSKSYLEKHMLKGCNKPKNYYALECDQCSEVFTRPVWQRYHKASVHDHQYRCEICEISFPSQKHLDKHKCRGHKTSCCPHCKKRFNNDISLGRHIRRAHNSNRNIMKKIHTPASGTNVTDMEVDTSHLLTTQATNNSNCSGQMSQIVKSNCAKRKCIEVPKDTIITIPIKNCNKHLAHCRIHAIDCRYKFTNFCFKKENGKFICDFCENSYGTRIELQKHVHPDPYLSCKFCQSKFLDYPSIEFHLRFKHPDKVSKILQRMCNCILKIPSMSVLSVESIEKNDNSENPVNIETNKDITKNDQIQNMNRVYKLKLKKMVPVNTSMFTSQCMDVVESKNSDVTPKAFVTSFETYNIHIPYPIPTTSNEVSNLRIPVGFFRRKSSLRPTNLQNPRIARGYQKQIRKYTTELQNNEFAKILKDKLGLQLKISKPCGRKETTAQISNLLTLVPINHQQNTTTISASATKLNSSVILEGKSESNIDQQSTKELVEPSSSKVDISAREPNTESTTLNLQRTEVIKEGQGSQLDHKESPTETDNKKMTENNQETIKMSSGSQKITLSEWLNSNLENPKSTQHVTKANNTIPMPGLVPISFPQNEAQKMVSIAPSLVPIDAKKKTLQEISTNLQKANLTGVALEKNASTCLKLSNTNDSVNSLGKTPSLKHREKKYFTIAELRKTLKTMEKGNHKILLEHNLWDLLNPQDKSQLLAFIRAIRDSHPTKSIMFVKINSEIHAYTLMKNTTNEEKVVRLLPNQSKRQNSAKVSASPEFQNSADEKLNVDSRPTGSKL